MNNENLNGYECDGQLTLSDYLQAEYIREHSRKYRNRKTTVDGIEFDSRAEAIRYQELITQQNLGIINNLERQKAFVVIEAGEWENGKKYQATKYIADFVYELDGKTVVEDVKGFKTKEYKLKKKLMKEKHGIEIQEVRR